MKGRISHLNTLSETSFGQTGGLLALLVNNIGLLIGTEDSRSLLGETLKLDNPKTNVFTPRAFN